MLITLQEYKDAKGLSKSDDDAKLTVLIERVSDIIQTYLGYTLVGDPLENITEYISLDYDTDIVYLDRFPINSIVSVTEANPYSYDSTIHLPLAISLDYIFDATRGRLLRKNGYWGTGINSIAVTYTAGFTETPSALKLAVIDLVTYYHKEEYKVSRSTGGASIQNPDTSPSKQYDFPGHIKRVLDLYREL